MLEKHWRIFWPALTALLDFIVIFISLAIGYAVNFPVFSFSAFLFHQWKLVLYTIVLFLGLCAIFGGYRKMYTSELRLQLVAAARSYLLCTLIVFATLFLFRNTYYSNGALITYAVFMPTIFLIVRLVLELWRQRLHRAEWAVERCVVVLLDSQAVDSIGLLNLSSGFSVKSVLDVSGMSASEANRATHDCIRSLQPESVIFNSGAIDADRVNLVLEMQSQTASSIRLITPEIHDVLIRTRQYDFGGIRISGASASGLERRFRWFRRFLDLAVGFALLIILAPLFLITAIAIKVETPGNVLFAQVRSASRQSKRLRVFKFRSMIQGAEKMPDPVVSSPRLEDDILLKHPTDRRITRVGRLIRKFSLDEIPQLFNVVKGEMTLVGPRPLSISDFGKIPAEGPIASLFERRALVKPGVTGLWQVSGRSGLNFRQMVILDLYYAENKSILFDLEIFFKTIPVVLSGRGAY